VLEAGSYKGTRFSRASKVQKENPSILPKAGAQPQAERTA
jgi:hypothetical protein